MKVRHEENIEITTLVCEEVVILKLIPYGLFFILILDTSGYP
jgi:hypothetical protein